MSEKLYYLQAFRKMDIRTVFICSTLDDDDHVILTDLLMDTEFIVTKIDEDEFFFAFDNCKWVYTLNEENFDKFEHFIRTNYERTIDIFLPKQPKQIQ